MVSCANAVVLRRVAAAVVAGLVAVASARASLAQGAPVPIGSDISYPQCRTSFPSGAAFAIVGVNSGLPFSPNPCLGASDGPSELQWGGASAQLYANTADPGPALSSHWPNGQTAPQQCNTATTPGADTSTCAYDYGWNAAQDSYQGAVNAYIELGLVPAGSTGTPSANVWWLDVESANSWETNTANNVAELQGEIDSLKSLGVATIGFYSPVANWQAITGGSTQFASYPFWLPGASSLTDAESRCSQTGPNGGPITLTQFPAATGGGDISCAQVPTLAFATSPRTVAEGQAAGPIVLQLPIAADAALTATLTSSSAAGGFATSAAGPWATGLTITVPAGATQSSAFYYRDTTAGAPRLRASASGYADATQSETITAPVCTVTATHDRGYELALTHLPTAASAERLLRKISRQTRTQHLHVLIERDVCTDFEVAITGFRGRRAALAGMLQARSAYPQATLEKP